MWGKNFSIVCWYGIYILCSGGGNSFWPHRSRQRPTTLTSVYLYGLLEASSWQEPRTFTSFNGLNYNLLDSGIGGGRPSRVNPSSSRLQRLRTRCVEVQLLICAMPTSNSHQYRKQAHIELMFLASKGWWKVTRCRFSRHDEQYWP